MTALEPSPFRLTELTDCGGCAAKLGADLLAEALAGLGAEAAAVARRSCIAGLDPARRRGRLPRQRRPGDHRHARLLPAARRRPADVRRDRRRECAVGRLRDGRPGAVRAVDRGVPRGPAARRPDRDLRRRLVQGPRGGRHARRRPHDPRPGAEVRPRGHRRRASGQAAAQGRRTTGRSARPDQAARDRRPGLRLAPGPHQRGGPRRRHRRHAPPQPGRLGGARRDRRSAPRPTSRASASSATASRWPAAPAPDSSSTRRRCPLLAGARELAAAGVETGGAAHNRRFVAAVARGRPGGAATNSSRSPTTRRPRAGSSRPSPRIASRHSRRPSTPPVSSTGGSAVSRQVSLASASPDSGVRRRGPAASSLSGGRGPSGARLRRRSRSRRARRGTPAQRLA